MLILFIVLKQTRHIRHFIRIFFAILAFPHLSIGLAVSSEPVSDAKYDHMRRFAVYNHIEVDEDAHIVDFPILSISEGELSDFGLGVAYNGKHVEILGVTTPVAETRLAYDFNEETLHFYWERSSTVTISKGDTLAILRVYLKHKPTGQLGRYFHIDSDEHAQRPEKYLENWQVALPKVALYYYETAEDSEESNEETTVDQQPANAYNPEIALKQQGGKASTVEIMSVIPNPMKSWADITYSVYQDCIVSLKLYTLLGEEVATLVNDRRSAGLYRHNITPPGFAAGIYVLRLATVHDNTMESDIVKVVVHNN